MHECTCLCSRFCEISEMPVMKDHVASSEIIRRSSSATTSEKDHDLPSPQLTPGEKSTDAPGAWVARSRTALKRDELFNSPYVMAVTA
mmetsp:Transcript_48088/g.145238  ORF Transcript_48088/g.145238 Transcript_48088/m.145238 type:complete len:88 (+) Transcript_48088:392-655(+)